MPRGHNDGLPHQEGKNARHDAQSNDQQTVPKHGRGNGIVQVSIDGGILECLIDGDQRGDRIDCFANLSGNHQRKSSGNDGKKQPGQEKPLVLKIIWIKSAERAHGT